MEPAVVQGVHVPENIDSEDIDVETLRLYHAELRMPALEEELDVMQMDEVPNEVLAELRLVIEAALRQVKAKGAFKADIRFGAEGSTSSLVTDVMLNLLQMKLADKAQALLALDS